MKRTLWLLLCVLVSSGTSAETAPPERVVSINLCSDQLLLLLAEPGQIASISRLALEPNSSYMAAAASAYPPNDAKIEQLLTLQPDLIVSSTHTPAARLLHSLGYRIETLPLASSITQIRSNIRRMAKLLGVEARGKQLIDEMDGRLRQVSGRPRLQRPSALFYQPRGYTSGLETLQNEALQLAGWRNVSAEMGIRGYGTIDLESLLLAEPQQLFTSAYAPGTESLAQREMQHPALLRITEGRPIIDIAYKFWICGGPMIADAVEALAAAHPEPAETTP